MMLNSSESCDQTSGDFGSVRSRRESEATIIVGSIRFRPGRECPRNIRVFHSRGSALTLRYSTSITPGPEPISTRSFPSFAPVMTRFSFTS